MTAQNDSDVKAQAAEDSARDAAPEDTGDSKQEAASEDAEGSDMEYDESEIPPIDEEAILLGSWDPNDYPPVNPEMIGIRTEES